MRVCSRVLIATEQRRGSSATHNTIYIRVWGSAIVGCAWPSMLDFGGSCLIPFILFPVVAAAQSLVYDKPNDANQSDQSNGASNGASNDGCGIGATTC